MIDNRILIIGGSGFVGNTLYRELLPYFDVYGTYCSQFGKFSENQVFCHFDAETDDILPLLEELRPGIIISAFTVVESQQIKVYGQIASYCLNNPGSRLVVFSSPAVFDAQYLYPAYEDDRTVSRSRIGKMEITGEKFLLDKISPQLIVARIPILLGTNAPAVLKLKQAIKQKAHFELYPNHIVSVSTADKLAQQIHYLINKDKTGIFHLCSTDVIHHDELFREIASGISNQLPVFDYVYHSNEDRYQAILPKINMLPPAYRITVNEAVDYTVLSEQITTLKNS